MCVAVGIGPAEVLELDADMFDALERAAANRWPVEAELAAVHAELASAHLVAFLAAHTKKGRPLPPVLRVPRPGDDLEADRGPQRLSPAAFAGMFATRVAPAGGGEG